MQNLRKMLLRRMDGRKRGFTLIELLIVLSILAVLAAVVVLALTGFIGRGEEAACETDEDNIQTAAISYYYEEDGTWPGTDGDLWGEWTDGNPPDGGDLIPTYLYEVPSSDKDCDWHLTSAGQVCKNSTNCPTDCSTACSTE